MLPWLSVGTRLVQRTAPPVARIVPSVSWCIVSANRSMASHSLESLAFDNRALQKLPVDQEEGNHVRTVPGL